MLSCMAHKRQPRRGTYERDPWWARQYGGTPVWMLLAVLLIGGGAVVAGLILGSG